MPVSKRFLPPIPKDCQIFWPDVEVAGIRYRLNDVIAFIKSNGNILEIKQEPNNKADKNALAVYGKSKGLFGTSVKMVGYIPAELSKIIADNNLYCYISPRIRNLYISNDGYCAIKLDIIGLKSEYQKIRHNSNHQSEDLPPYDEDVDDINTEISIIKQKSIKPKSSEGCGLVILALFSLLFLLVIINGKSCENKTVKDNALENVVKAEKNTAVNKPISEITNDVNNTIQNPLPEFNPVTKPITSYGEYQLPFSLITTEPINLRNASGKEITFPAGSIINVMNRTNSGTLTTNVNGVMFVGNESRLIGKSKLR